MSSFKAFSSSPRKPSGLAEPLIERFDTIGKPYEAGAPESKKGKTTAFQAYMSLVKASVGPGCLSLPLAFANAGTLLGPLLLCFLCFVAWYNMQTLVFVRHYLQAKHPEAVIRSYGKKTPSRYTHTLTHSHTPTPRRYRTLCNRSKGEACG
jgi:hypothetical protein